MGVTIEIYYILGIISGADWSRRVHDIQLSRVKSSLCSMFIGGLPGQSERERKNE